MNENADITKSTLSSFTILQSVYAKDTAEALDDSLRSIALSTQLPAEMILVKDGPISRQLSRIIEEWQKNCRFRLQVVGYEENKGLSYALAFGLKFVKTELVARMDSDDVCLPDRFEKQLRFMEENPEIAISSGAIDEFYENPEKPFSVRRVPFTPEAVLKGLKKRCPFNHMAVMFRKSAVESVGSYQTVAYFEDYDLWFRLLMTGFKGANLPDTLVHARIGNGMIGRRHGFSYARHELNFLRLERSRGYLSFGEYARALAMRIPVRLLPKPFLAFVYWIVRKL